jgi:serine protease
MGFPDSSLRARARLDIEKLEDRTVPANLDAALTAALPEVAATVAVVGDRVNVVMAAETTSATDTAALAAAPFASDVEALGFGIYSVTLTPGTDLAAAIAYYGQVSGVLSAEPDRIIQVQQTPNDPQYSQLYGMTKIGAPAAWDTTTGSTKVVVGVIDTGVDHTHQDLYLNVWINQAEIPSAVRALLTDTDGDSLITFRDLNNPVNIGLGKITDLNGNGRIEGSDLLFSTAAGGWADGTDAGANGYTDDLIGWDFVNNDNNPLDDNNHGTHVAGTIGAVGNNAVGVAGVNWSVSIAGLKFLSASGSGAISGATAALNYAVNAGIKITNNSWGGGGFSSAMSTAISRARDAGHIFVAAAGNSGSNNDATANYPSNYNFDNVVAVAATDSNDNLASFSSYGATTVDLAAPGVNIRSTTRNNTYSNFSGTSMATPHVAGAIALYWGANPTLTYSQVIDKLKSSVDTVASLSGRVATGGRLNVAKMFATSPPPAPPGPKVTAAAFSGSTSTQFDKVRVTFDKAISASTFDAADVFSFTGPSGAIPTSAITGVTPVGTAGTQFDITFTAQTTGGNYSLTFGPDIRDTANNTPMDQNGNGTAGEAADRYTASGTLVLTTTRTYSNTTAVAIRDFATTVSTITITDNIRISDLNARVNLTHTYDSDLTITLTSPTGTTITLFNRRGGSGNNLNNTLFDDEAGTAIANGAAPFSGSFRPEVALTAFDGQSTVGTWTLRVTDGFRLDTGTLWNWSLIATGTLGNGGSGTATAMGFEDEPAFADEPTTQAEPAVVSTPRADAAPAAGSAFGLLVWMNSEEREFDAPPVASESRSALTAPPSDNRAAAPEAATYAPLLYFPPEEDAGDEELPFAEE